MEKLVVVKTLGSNPDRDWPGLANYSEHLDIQWVDAPHTPLRSINAEIGALTQSIEAIKQALTPGAHAAAAGSNCTALISAIEDLMRDGAPTPRSTALVNPQRFTRARPHWDAASILSWREGNRDERAERTYEMLTSGRPDPGRAAVTEVETIVSSKYPDGGYGVPKTWSTLTNAYFDIPTLVLRSPLPTGTRTTMFTEAAEVMQRSGAILRDLDNPQAVSGSVVAWVDQVVALEQSAQDLQRLGWVIVPPAEPRFLADPDWVAEHPDGRRLELLNRASGNVGIAIRKARDDSWVSDALAYFEADPEDVLVDRTAVRAAADFPDSALERDPAVVLSPEELVVVTETVLDVARIAQHVNP